MRALINGRFAGRRITGVERYASEITAALGPRVKIILPRRDLRGWRGHCWEQTALPSLVPKGGVLWSPANSGPLRVERHVVTLHDLSPLDHPDWFRPSYATWYRWLLPRLARRAAFVMTPSAFTAGQVRLLGVAPDRIRVVPPGVSPHFQTASCAAQESLRARHGLRQRYVLFVGTLEPRKNLARLVEAWEQVAPRFRGTELILAGTTAASFQEVRGLRRSPRTRLVGYVPDDELPALYSAAEAFVLVSQTEGFGLTALEAMACGTPLLLSRSGGLPEAAGEAALYVDSQDSGQISDGLTRILQDGDLRAKLRQAGQDRASQFRWERSADRVAQVLEEAASS